jgi:TonB family protein
MKVISSIILILALFSYVRPQSSGNGQSTGWIRIVSDDHEFSIEVPSKYNFFFDREGFMVGKDDSEHELKNVRMLTAYQNGTLLSFEAFDGDKAAFQALYDDDAYDDEGRKTSEKKIGDIKIKEVRNSTKDHYAVRRFIRTEKNIYILTAATRSGESSDMNRFLNSVKMDRSTNASDDVAVKFSQLISQNPKISFDEQKSFTPVKVPASKQPQDPSVKPAVTVRATRVSYVAAARDHQVQGTIVLKLKVNDDGAITEIVVLKSLPDGLLKQAIFGALRTKFLPKEKDGVPVPVNKTLEFGFKIY